MTDGTSLYVLGSSGHAREVAAYARSLDPSRCIVFVDNAHQGENCITVQEYWQCIASREGESIIGAGWCEVRKRMLGEIKPPFATIIHPTAVVLGNVAEGCVIAPGAIIAPNAHLQPHVLVNYNATVGHDAVIGPLSVIGPGAAVGGWCQLGTAAYVGAGALVREKLVVGSDAVVGMGAVVTKDVGEGHTVIGLPARPLPCKAISDTRAIPLKPEMKTELGREERE